MQALSIMTRVFKNGSKVVVSKRGKNTILQKFWSDGTLAETKVKNITRANVGDKKIITKKELFYENEQHYVEGVYQKTTDKVYTANGELLGAREVQITNADSCNHNLRSVIANMKDKKNVCINKRFLTPDGNVYKDVTIGENGLRQYVVYFPDQYGRGHFVPANSKGVMNSHIAGLDFIS